MGFEVTFEYNRREGGLGDTTWVFLVKDGITYEANSFCHILDTFIKEKGRKIALKRALSTTNLSKAERTQFWKEYFGRKTAK